MKKTLFILTIALLVTGVYAAYQRFSATTNQNLLDLIQAVEPGTTKDEVLAFMDREPSIMPGDRMTGWMGKAASGHKNGEYWYFFMGYPPRNLIIFFGDDERVVFATWDWT